MNNVVTMLVGLIMIAISPVYAAPEVVLEQGDITVTVEDVERYIISNTPEAQREAILNRKGIFKEMIENIYLIRRIGTEAEQSKNLDWEQLEWDNALSQKRRAMTLFMKGLVKQQLESFDWEALAKETYLAEGENYHIPERVHVSHILINTEERSDEEAKNRIDEIKEKILAGEDFGVLAKAYSEDPSIESNGGNLGFFSRGKMVKAFEEAAFAMEKEGELKIVKSNFGYHLIQFHQREAAKKQDFEMVKRQIILQLKQSRANQVRQDIMTGFRSDSALKWDASLLESLQKKYRIPISELDNTEIESSAE